MIINKTKFVMNKRVLNKLMRNTEKKLDLAGNVLTLEVKKNLSGPQTSKKLGKISGTLQDSIKQNNNEIKQGRVKVETDVPYAPIHEFGSLQFPARPFMRVAIKTAKQKITKLFKNII